jgi:putative glycerol-1-phosphate prenyltransferase
VEDSGAVYRHLVTRADRRGGGFMLLIDPDRAPAGQYLALAEASESCGVDAIMVGTSFMLDASFPEAVRQIKARTRVPVIIFPGSFAQINPHADAILFSSLLSGRNPTYLIDEQVKGAPLVHRYDLEAIPTGYLLVESGPLTSVQFISNTNPIPRNKPDIACAHALAAQYLGMKLVYLEAGSGAEMPVPEEMTAVCSEYLEIPLVVGGGLRSPEECRNRVEAGASLVVVGTGLEDDPQFTYLRELTAAVHTRDSVTI